MADLGMVERGLSRVMEEVMLAPREVSEAYRRVLPKVLQAALQDMNATLERQNAILMQNQEKLIQAHAQVASRERAASRQACLATTQLQERLALDRHNNETIAMLRRQAVEQQRGKAKDDEERRRAERGKNLVVLMLQHLLSLGYSGAAEVLQAESGVGLTQYEPADNIDLMSILQEWEDHYEYKFQRRAKLVRKLSKYSEEVNGPRGAMPKIGGGRRRGSAPESKAGHEPSDRARKVCAGPKRAQSGKDAGGRAGKANPAQAPSGPGGGPARLALCGQHAPGPAQAAAEAAGAGSDAHAATCNAASCTGTPTVPSTSQSASLWPLRSMEFTSVTLSPRRLIARRSGSAFSAHASRGAIAWRASSAASASQDMALCNSGPGEGDNASKWRSKTGAAAPALKK